MVQVERCPVCGGRGTMSNSFYEYESTPKTPLPYAYEVVCHTCQGKGYILIDDLQKYILTNISTNSSADSFNNDPNVTYHTYSRKFEDNNVVCCKYDWELGLGDTRSSGRVSPHDYAVWEIVKLICSSRPDCEQCTYRGDGENKCVSVLKSIISERLTALENNEYRTE